MIMEKKRKEYSSNDSINYKQLVLSKRSQVTLFVIIAIVLIAAIVLVFYLTPVKNIFIQSNPSIQLQGCIKPALEKAIANLSAKGGSFNPVNSIMYKGEKIEYLCYTNEYYQTCSNQQPLLKQHIEREILANIQPKINQCYDSLKSSLISSGYTLTTQKSETTNVEISQNNVKVKISGATFSKADSSEKYSSFEISQKSSLYNLVMLTNSILNWEARYGDSDTTSYMMYYPNIKVEKYKQMDGSKIYILTDSSTKDKFTFATRSLSWPSGYGIGETYKPVIV